MQRNLLIRILVLVLAAALLLCAGCDKNPEPASSGTPDPENTLSTPINEDMKIETPYCDLTIPYAFTELVTVAKDETEGVVSYAFSAALEDRSVPVYTIRFVKGDEEALGQLFGTLKTDEGSVRVLYEAYDADKSLAEDDLESFYSAQETINDVFASLQAASGFTAA